MIKNVTPQETWDALLADPMAFLVDVRSEPEWSFVGLPNLAEAGKQPVLVPWQVYPSMQINPNFMQAMRDAGATPEHAIYFICRSGARSLVAAQTAQAAGFERSFNVAGGFEGPTDEHGHRGGVEGWKADGLPWHQR